VAFFPETAGGPGFWAVTRYEDVRSVSLDQQTFSSWRGGVMLRDFTPDMLAAQQETLPSMPPGRHGKHRRLVSGAFAPKVMRALEARIRDLAKRIVGAVASKGECDFVTQVASELPVQVICELIGIPAEDRDKIVTWSNAIVGMDDPEYGESAAGSALAAMEICAYADGLAAARTREPRDDVASLLLTAEVDGERLDAARFGAFVMVLAVAGNETTRNAISGGLLALFEHPAERARLQADPSLLPTAADEILRWVTPVMHFRRTAERDVELGGQQIRAGDKVVVWYAAANRDEAVFPEPDRFDVGRAPNEHLTFGFGPHFCLGAVLARLEIQILLDELFRRLPDVAPAGPVVRMRGNHIAGIKHMPVRFTPT
jgi:cholest-4-en-3-one 26-monooxygenase